LIGEESMNMWKRDRSERSALDDMMAESVKSYEPAYTPPPITAPATTLASPPPAQPPAAGKAAAPDMSPARAAASAAPGAKVSVLGPSLKFKGDLVADEDLVVQGQIEGSILHTRSLTIGAQGRMNGDIKARRITVEGTVDGDLYALESVVLRAGAIVRGNVFANKVSVAEGARFSGRIDMDNAPTVPSVAVRPPGSPEATPEHNDLTDQQVGELLAKA
jgi:cytoskeletal protein CcmA (bactofilin family)